MEQLYCKVREEEEEEEEEEELQDGAALKGRQSLQQGKHGSVTNAEAASFFSSVGEQPFPQKEEVLHTHEEHREQPAEKVEETNDVVAENGNDFNDDSEKVGFGIIAEIVENAINGEAISSATINADASQHKNCVYFDKQQGMWKCHHCAWTKQFDSPWNLRRENLNGYSDLLMNVKTMTQHGTCFVCEIKGNNIDGAKSDLQKSIEEEENSEIQCSPCNGVKNMEIVEEKVPSSVAESPSPNSSEIQAAAAEDNFGDESSAKTYPNMTEEIDQQLKEYDVEAVLAKQQTHDLFCPNCKSCITKRVILRKRKRTTPIPNLDTKAKRDKSEIELVDSSADEGNQGDHAIATPDDVGRVEPPADNFEPEREPEVFRCLSCFSFFIPMRNGFKLFPSFGGKPDASQKISLIPAASNVENPSIVASSNSNWFFTLFTSIKGRKDSAQGDASIEDSRTDPTSIEDSRIDNPESSPANTPISHGGVNSSIPSIVNSVVKIESWIEKGKKSNVALQNETLVEQNDSHTQSSSDVDDKNRDSVVVIKTDAVADITKHDILATVATTENAKEKIRDPVDVIKTDISKPDAVLVATVATTEVLFNAAGKPAKDAILKPYEGSTIFDKTQKDEDNALEIAQNSYSSLMKEAQSPEQSFGSEVVANDVARDKQNFIRNGSIPSIQDFMKVQTGIEDEIKPSVAKEKEEAFETSTSQAAEVPTEGAIVTEAHTEIYIGEQPRAEIGEHQEWEILKSIVYGGLVESITSLGVVSSAASSGAAPLNIIALGLANIIGGLFVIGHNLIDLKNGHSGGNPSQDRYEEQLGRRENFKLHVFLAVLSFIIFGSVPLGVYGLFISKHYYGEENIVAVTATCVVCIILLAMGKTYTSRPPKSYVKTVLHYVSLALATSGISYIAGDLVKDLIDKISGSESGYVLAMPLSDTTRMEPARMSY